MIGLGSEVQFNMLLDVGRALNSQQISTALINDVTSDDVEYLSSLGYPFTPMDMYVLHLDVSPTSLSS